MAKTYFDYTGDGSRTVYPAAFALGYLDKGDVYVYTGTDYTTQLSYTWQDSTTVELSAPIPVGDSLRVRRVVNRSILTNDYQNGAVMEADNLDDSFKQALMIAEEIEDGFLSANGNVLLGDVVMERILIGGLDYGTVLQEQMDAREVLIQQQVDAEVQTVTDLAAEVQERITEVENIIVAGDTRYIEYNYNGGSANGGELVLTVPYTWESINRVYIGGVRQTQGLAWDYDTTAQTIELAEELEAGDEVVIEIGLNPERVIDNAVVSGDAEVPRTNGGGALKLSDIVASSTLPVEDVTALRLFEPTVEGQECKLSGHTVTGVGGGTLYAVLNDAATDNGVTVFKTPLGHTWNRSYTDIHLEMAGATGANDEDVTTYITMIKPLTNRIIISNKSITLTADIQLDGVTVYGADTVVKGYELVGGTLINITSDEQHERITPTVNQSPQTSRCKTKLVVRETSIPTGTPLDAYSVVSPSTYGGIARFILATGVGGSGSGDLGGTWDRLRVVGSRLYTDGYAINNTVTAQSGTVSAATHQLENFLSVVTDRYTPDGTNTITDLQLDQNEWVEFTVNGNVHQRGNVAFYTSSGSSDDITVLVNGIDVTTKNSKTVSGAAANTIRLIEVNYDRAVGNVVRITNNHATAKAYVYGVNLYKVSNLAGMDAVEAGYIDNFVLSGERNVLYSGNGASLDHVVRDNNSKLGGSYHGGETAMGTAVSLRLQAAADFKKVEVTTSVNTSPASISVGEVYCANHILALSLTSIAVNEGTLNTRTALDFGVDGGCNVIGSMNATSTLTLTRLYSGMHATDRTLNKYLTGSVIEGTPTEDNLPIKRSMLPFFQFNNASTQCCISPQTFEFGMSKKQARIWDNVNYIKFYYQPLDNVEYVMEAGEDLRFSCLYQYGENLI